MATGTVKWFNTTKGYGFIAPEGGGNDVFVHISAVERSGLTGLADDQKVTYELQEGRDGRQNAVTSNWSDIPRNRRNLRPLPEGPHCVRRGPSGMSGHITGSMRFSA